jgi:hypothetical protein
MRIFLQELEGCCVEGIVTRAASNSSKVKVSNYNSLSKTIT